MANVTPNGTYKGRVYDAGESHDATLTITSSDPQTGNISQASMDYYKLKFKVTGTFTYENLSNESPVSFNLRAEAAPPEHNVLAISARSPDRSYKTIQGTVVPLRGGHNVGITYNIIFNKS